MDEEESVQFNSMIESFRHTPIEDEQDETVVDDVDEDILEIEGEEPVDTENATIRRMREHLDRLEKENRSLKVNAPKVELGPEPDLEDFGYDGVKFAAAVIEYDKKKQELAEQEAQADEPQHRIVQQFQTRQADYAREKAQIRIPDFDKLESRVEAVFSFEQQRTLIMAAKNKAAVVAALGRYPNRLEALAKLENPIDLAIAISELERNIKVKPRTKGVEPEDKMRGTAPLGQTTREKEIAKLENKMMAGGDVTEIRKRLKELRG
jgi:hypothetical protein